jgi:hypothetical protein
MQDAAKQAAAVYGTKSDGSQVLRGHHAIDPSGHLVLVPKDLDLPDDGWRWATDEDVADTEARAAQVLAEDAG